MQASFKLDLTQFNKVMSKLKTGLSDFHRPLKETSNFQMDEVKRQFETEGAAITGKWQSLSSRTIAQRIAMGYGSGPILQRTGQLKSSFKQKLLTKNRLIIGTDNKYFPHHQMGTKEIPQRQILAHSSQMIDKTLQIFSKYLANLIRNG